ncbi:very-short-patch-repair endonuclease [Microbacterium sp. ZKA21]|jgi:very-short-patch-repair endonuclease|uniref:endonuclease domain-containing protein n=1 Tax=Microbacterium sp. ZKA21 TaxID=3381694 RepID=UPI003D1E3E76
MLSANDTITRLGGIARGSTLQHLGFTRQALAVETRRGTIQRIRNGVFATTTLNDDVRTAIEHGGALTCASVLRVRGVWVLPRPDGLHVWMPSKRHPLSHPSCTCVSHYFRGSPPLGSASIETALLHLRRCAGDEAFFAAYESAWRQRLLSRAARARLRSALPGTARWLVDIARADADSGLESLLRLRFHLLGIRFDCQVTLDGVGRVDFVVAGRLIIEADGDENHGSSTKRHRDRVRDAAASDLGYETLRFDYAQIVHDWPTVQAAILAALRRLRMMR